jgi:copper chaperone CopZ
MVRISFVCLALVLLAAACDRASSTSSTAASGTIAEAPAVTVAVATTPTAATPAAAAPAPTVPAEVSCGQEGGEGEHAGSCGQPGSGCNQWDEEAMAVTRRDVPDTAIWKTWEVNGMHCGGCERKVMAKVGEIEGVVAVKANAGTGHVAVAVKPGYENSFDRARERIGELGYKIQ